MASEPSASGQPSGEGRAEIPRDTARVRHLYERAAARYDRGIQGWERLLLGDGRAWVGARAQGAVLEVGIGTGRNLAHYSSDARLVGLDLSPAMLAIAERRAHDLGRTVDLWLGDAQALPFDAATFDTVVVTLALCSIPDHRQAVREMRRVLRDDGRLVWLEHVRSPLGPVRAVEWLLEPLSLRLAADSLLREPLESIAATGLQVEQLERSAWGIIERGVARASGTATIGGR